MPSLSELFGARPESKSKRPENVGLLYQKHITSGMTALVVGPSKLLSYDPSILYAASLLGASGTLYICDPQSSQTEKQSRPLPHTVRGYGDASIVMRDLEVLRGLGMELPTIQWLGPESYIQSTGLADGTIDVIVDHGTSPFVAGSLADPSELRHKNLILIYPEYARVLKPSGTVLLQINRNWFDTGTKPLQGELAKTLKHNFHLSYHRVDDQFDIPITPKVSDSIVAARTQTREVLPGFGINSVGATPYLYSDNGDHFCPDLYIGKKI